MEAKTVAFNVSRICSDERARWAVEFSDGVTLHIAKVRNESRIDAMVADVAARKLKGAHTARIREMVRAVREHERQTQ